MIETLHRYTQGTADIFESIIDNSQYKLNHLIIPPGKSFPRHPTDAKVTIIIIKGMLTLKLEDGQSIDYEAGYIIEIPKGTMSELGNNSKEITEVFVIKV